MELGAGARRSIPALRGHGRQAGDQDGHTNLTIELALENRMIDLQRAINRRYTAANQHIQYPNDTAFNWVETLSDQALRWGS